MSQYIDPSQVIEKDKKTGRVSVKTINREPSLTDQSATAESDINKIMAKYEKSGLITHLAKRPGAFSDVSNASDYQTMLSQIQEAETAFMTLPAAVRLKFKNDPGQLIEFLGDVKNKDEAIALGLIEKPPKEYPPLTPPSQPNTPPTQPNIST